MPIADVGTRGSPESYSAGTTAAGDDPRMDLEPVVDGQVWIAAGRTRVHGIEKETRMTVVRLEGGGLWVHSPIDADASLRRGLQELGTVRFVVAPSNRHHRFARGFHASCPGSELFVSPHLPEWNGSLAFGTPLGEGPPALWARDLDQAPVAGHRSLDEVVFLHRTSRTLIVADLLTWADEGSWLLKTLDRFFCHNVGSARRRPTTLTFSDKSSARRSLARVLAWDFDRIVPAHGRPVLEGAKTVLREAYRSLFELDPCCV